MIRKYYRNIVKTDEKWTIYDKTISKIRITKRKSFTAQFPHFENRLNPSNRLFQRVHPIAQNVSGNATENVTGEKVNVKDAQNHARYIIHNALLTKKCTKHILLSRATACANCCAA